MKKLDVSSINEQIKNNAPSFIKASENRYNMIIKNTVNTLEENQADILLLAGPSSSGKTTTAMKIKNALIERGKRAYVVSLDDFYRNRDDVEILPNGLRDIESVNALDLKTLERCVEELMNDGVSHLPIFDFPTGTRSEKTNLINHNHGDVVIIEGLHALNDELSRCFKWGNVLQAYVSVSSRVYDGEMVLLSKREMRLVRRIIRDHRDRNSSVENTFLLWKGVRKGEDKYLFPFKSNADIVIDSIHSYEPAIMASIALPLLEGVENDSVFYRSVQVLAEKLEQFTPLSIANVPNDSLLREFVGYD